MSLHLYLAFCLATAILILIPGPSVALIVANSVAHGIRFGLVTVIGTASANAAQLGLTMLGMAALQVVFATWFDALRWIGVAYLLVLAIQHWTAKPQDLTRTSAEPKSARHIFLRGFLVSLTNPKTLLFYGAFLPQFISPSAEPLPQWALLSATFLIIAFVLDCCWALLAGRLRVWLAGRGLWRNRITGGLLAGAGLGLALARKP